MDKAKVFLENIREYNMEEIKKSLAEGLEYLGVTLPENAKVLIKPNALGAYAPEMHITTHPVVIEAVLTLLAGRGNEIFLGDSSGNGQHGNTSRSLKKAGFEELGAKYGIKVISFDKYGSKSYIKEDNVFLKEVNLTSFIDEMDFIINMPKLKSHQLMNYTGAVKNLFGCVPGAGKLTCHINAPTPDQFADLLIDIYSIVKDKISLNVMDGIVGIEGAGPGPAGKIKPLGIFGVSTDAMAMDIACLDALGKKSREVYSVRTGLKRGVFHGEVETRGTIPAVTFDMPKPGFFAGLVHKIFPRFGMSRPYVEKEKCKKCTLCAKACPAKAITMKGIPVFDYSKCIYCYCCHENCPVPAIELKENLLLRIFKVFEKKEED